MAVAGKTGLAHYALFNRKWKLFGNETQVCVFETFSFFASSDLCHLLIAFANSLGPDQDRENVGSDLDSNRLTL